MNAAHLEHWHDQLSQLYDDEAIIEFEEEGRILYVWTWFIHHDRYKRCSAPRIVKLDSFKHLWYQDVTDPWQELLHPEDPITLAIIGHRPPHATTTMDTVHLMIEQQPRASRAAGVVSAVFHGQHEDRLLQAAYSLPRWLCVEDIVDILEINHICEVQICTALSGVAHFEKFIRHEIPSAISIELHVRHPGCHADRRASSSSEPFQPQRLMPTGAHSLLQRSTSVDRHAAESVQGRHLMQLRRRWHRHRPQPPISSGDDPSEHISDEHDQIPHRVAACAANVPPLLPMMVPMWPTEWTTLFDVWTFYYNQAVMPEGASIVAEVWYSDHSRRTWSEAGQAVTLHADFTQWVPRILDAWPEWYLPELPYDIFVVKPTPLGGNDGVQFHVLLLQQPRPDHKTILLTVMDEYTDPWVPGLISVVVPNILDHWILLQHAIVEFQCPPRVATAHCFSYFGNTDLSAGNLFPAQHGLCFTVVVEQQATGPIAEHLHDIEDEAALEEESTALIQLTAQRKQTDERLTDRLVAHGCQPSVPRVLALQELIPVSETPSSTTVVRMRSGVPELKVPEYLEVAIPCNQLTIEAELTHWGLHCTAIQFGLHDQYLCLPKDFSYSDGGSTYMFANDDLTDEHGCFPHKQHDDLNPQGVLRLLDSLGYARAVITEDVWLPCHLRRIRFVNVVPMHAKSTHTSREPTAWPSRDDFVWHERKLYNLHPAIAANPTHSVRTGFDQHDLQELVAAGHNFLHTGFEGLDLPDFIKEKVCAGRQCLTYDRWLIYTDGSSQSALRRMAPERVDDLGKPDAWAILVLGEKYMPEGASLIEPIGWCTHPVRYDATGSCYTHATRIGAEVAERDALIWAGIWRLSQDSVTPTVFCCDSLTCGKQAFGLIGTSNADPSYRLQRGIFQALEHGLPPGHLRLHHVLAHAGDPYNEFVDLVAKREGQQSFNHGRPKLDMQKWNEIFPHFWLQFAQKSGLPCWQNGQMHTPEPSLPKSQAVQPTSTCLPAVQVDFHISIASANVLSLSRGPDGHGGKLHYLFEQMKAHRLNVMGIQESRTDEGITTSHNVVRISGGHDKKSCGVELWVNLDQPIGHTVDGKKTYFQKSDFQVVVRDPRRLLVKVENKDFVCWFFVGHGPHSGKPTQERNAWWSKSIDILNSFLDQHPCFWMVDANAEPGEADNCTVFQKGLRSSRNTDLWRRCLQTFAMCLPSTTCIHQGDRDTWTSIDGTSTHCLDYIAVPSTWLSSCTWSQVLPELDLATTREDHQAVGIQLCWSELRAPRDPQTELPFIDWTSPNTPASLRTALDGLTVPSWDADIEAHESQVRLTFHEAMRRVSGKKPPGPKKSYISEDIWKTRQLMLHSRKQLKRGRALLGRECLAMAFKAWSQRDSDVSRDEASQYGTTLRTGMLRHMAGLIRHRTQLRTQLKAAKTEMMKNRLANIDENTPAGSILKLMREFTGPTNPRKRKQVTIPLVHRPDETPCRSPSEALDVWIDFFASMEGGFRQTHDELREDWLRSLKDRPTANFQIEAKQLPTLVDLELAFRKVACNKATGPDGIPGEVCHFAPEKCAQATFASMWKLILFGHEPLMHKGGLLVQAYKGKGVTTSCSSYRSLLISSHMGKSIHRTLRSAQASTFESFLQAQQIGGRRAMPVTYGVHLARAYLRQAKAQGRSCAIAFLDLKEAFYRIFRPICMQGAVTDEDLAKLMCRLNMPPDALQALRLILAGPSALEQAQLPEIERRSLQAVHLQTHFWMNRQQDVVQTAHGSRPGDPFADIVFSYVWAVVLRKLQSFMSDNDLISTFPSWPQIQLFADPDQEPGGTEEFVGPTWMDDLAVCVEGSTAAATVASMGIVMSRLLELCLEHCMTPNLNKNKTEILFSFRGAHSRHYKKLYHGPQSTGSFPVISEYGLHEVPLTASYCHLGGILHHSTDQKDEIKKRVGIAFAALNHHSKLLFRNWRLPLKKRTQLFESLILSKLLYGAETWVANDNATVDHFHAAVIKMYRRLLPLPVDQHMADDAILAEVSMPSPMELVRRARLRYVATLFHCGHRHEWGLLAQDAAWTTLVEEDMVWVWRQIWHSSSLPDPRVDWCTWQDLIIHHRSYWRRIVRRASEHAIQQRRKLWLARRFHVEMLSIFRALYDYEPHRKAPAHRVHEVYGCLSCQKFCRTRAGEAAHMFRVHQQVAKRRFLSDSTVCPSCLKEYHTMKKLTAHLYYVKACRQLLMSRNYACRPPPGAGSQQDRELSQQHDRLLPPIQAEGPRQPPPRLREEREVDSDLHMFFMETFIDVEDFANALQAFKEEAQQRPISWSTWTSTLRYFMETLEDADFEKWNVSAQAARAQLAELLDPEQWGLQNLTVQENTDMEELEQECRDVAVTEWKQCADIPRQFGRHRILLHMFSGRRRVGDVQYFLDNMETPKEYVLHVVSMDLVVDAVWGDAMAIGTRTYWLQAAKDGYIAAFLAGPPCETWSKARGRKIASGRGPRVVRDASNLWGLQCLALKEVMQVITGNELLTFTLLMAGYVVCTGGSGVVEHPAEPEEPEAASIWKLPVMLALMQAPGVQRVRLSQGLFGAPTAKPTELLTINMPKLPLYLRKWLTRPELPRGQAIGVTEEGFFRTALLKEYPPALCGAIAEAFRDQLDSLVVKDTEMPPEADIAKWKSMTVTKYSGHIGADYAG